MIAGSHLVAGLEMLLIYNCTALKTSKQTYCSAKEHYRGGRQKSSANSLKTMRLLMQKRITNDECAETIIVRRGTPRIKLKASGLCSYAAACNFSTHLGVCRESRLIYTGGG